MNIIKLQDMLRGVEDNALINYVQNPNGQVPSYLALSELQRRKEVRDNYQAAKPEQKSVAEDLTQPAQPQGGLAMLAGQAQNAPQSQGVAGLPVDDGMYQEQNFAGGGIIAFDDGGDVAASDMTTSTAPSSADMSYDALVASGVHPMNAAALKGMLPTPGTYTGATAGPASASSLPYGSDMAGEMMRVSPDVFRYSDYGVGRGTSPEAYAGYAAIRKEMGSPGYATGGEVQRYASKGLVNLAPDFSVPEKPGFMQRFFGSSSTDLLEQERQRLLNKIKNPMNPYNDLDYQQLQEVEAKLAGKTQPGGAMTVKEGQATQKKYEADLLKSKEPPPPSPPKEEAPKQEKPFNPYAIDSGYKARPETDAEEKMARFDKLYGEDPAKERLTKRLTKMEERAAREEAQSPWMAITRAGLKTLAGTSPFAAVNVGAGAVEGLESYAASQDRLAKMEDKRMDIDSRLAEAERAKKLAAVQYGVNSEEYAKKANDEYQLKKMQSIYEVEKYKELNPYTAYGKVAEIQSKKEAARAQALKEREYRTASLYAGKTIDKNTPKEEADKINDARAKMKELERKLDAQFPVPALPGQAPATTTPTLRYDPALGKVMPI